MPIMKCRKNNKPGWKFGRLGFCYTYNKGNRVSSDRAKGKAGKQGRAVKHKK